MQKELLYTKMEFYVGVRAKDTPDKGLSGRERTRMLRLAW